MTVRAKAWLISGALACVGTVLVVRYANAWVAVGFFLMMWGNNLERSSRRILESEPK